MGDTSGKTVNEPSLLPMFSNEYLLWLRAAEEKWAHKTTPLTLMWLFTFLHFVSWDTSYGLLRPRNMIGGGLHYPIFVPYALYSSVDYFYEFPAYSEKDGFTSAVFGQHCGDTGILDIYGHSLESRDEPRTERVEKEDRAIEGRWGASAALAVSVMTVSKTTLYRES